MPLYDFTCPACGETHEELVPAQTENDPCPNCGAPAARRFSLIAPLPRLGLRGVEAKRSDAKRTQREIERHAGFRRKREG